MSEIKRFADNTNPADLFPDSRDGGTLPLQAFAYELPSPDGKGMANRDILFEPAYTEDRELERLQTADKYLDGEEKERFVAREVNRERDVYQTGRKFMTGLEGSFLNSEAGYLRMMGQDEEADKIQDQLNRPDRQRRLNYLQKMADEQSDFYGAYLKEELEQTFVGDLAQGAGGLTGQISMVSGSTLLGGPKAGFLALTAQVVGQNFEGNYQASKSARLEKAMEGVENPLLLSDEEIGAMQSKIDEEAKSDAYGNLWTAIPEIALDKIFMGSAGKLFRGTAGSTKDKLLTYTWGSLAEGSSEAVSSGLQNWMIQRNIDPEQKITEGTLRDFAIGTILGAGANTLSLGVGEGESALIKDVEAFRKEVLTRAKKESLEGDEQATKFLKDYEQAVEQIIISENSNTVKSVSVGVSDGGMSVADVQKAIAKEAKAISHNLPIHIVENAEGLGSIEPSLDGKFKTGDGIEGLYVGREGDKKVILVASELNSVSDVQRVLRHEAIGHFGTEAVSGPLQDAFYDQVGRQYVNTPLGRRIIKDYSNDSNFNQITLGKEIVARVSEKPNSQGGLKQSVIDAFHKVTGNKIQPTPDTDRQILKAVSLANQLIKTPTLNKVNQQITSRSTDAQDDEVDNILASRFSDFVRESASVKNFSSSQGTGRKYGIPKDFEAEAEALTAGKPGQLVKLDETHALHQEFHSVVDYAIYDPDTGERTSRKPKYFGFTKYEDPDSNSEALDKDGFPRKFVWAFQPLDNAYDMVETSTSDFDEALAFAESEDMDRRIDLSEEDPSLDDVLFSKKDRGQYAQTLASLEMDRPQVNRDLDILEQRADEASALPPEENAQATQRKNTIPTYIKSKQYLDELQKGGNTLDYGAGLGYGSLAIGADSFEPFARENFVTSMDEDYKPILFGEPKYKQSKEIPDESYDKIISPNVLNVVRNDLGQRDKVVQDIGRVLKVGGRAVIQARDVSAVMGAKTARPGPEENSVIAKSEGRETFQKGFSSDELQQYVSQVLGIGFTVNKVPSNRSISGSAVLVHKDPKVMGAIKKKNSEILLSKKSKELQQGIVKDERGNLFYKGRAPMEWSPEDFKEVGDIYGVENLGPLTPLVEVKDPETGKTYKMPGGLDGKFTYYDMLWIKNNQPGINNVGEQTHAKITKKLSESLTPKSVDKVQQFNRLAFGFLSPNAPLLPNEYGVARIFSQSMDDIQRLADMADSYPPDLPKPPVVKTKPIFKDNKNKPIKVNPDGTITVYHRTNVDPKEINKQGFISKENTKEIFVSSKNKGMAEGYGKNAIALKVKQEDLEIDDAFDGEAHFRLKIGPANKALAEAIKLQKEKDKLSKARSDWNKTVKKAFDIGARGKEGGIGIGLTQDFSLLANFARLYVKNPDFFIKKADESWSDYVDKVSTQVGGFGTKTATFGGVWQDPYNAMISAIDRHMAKAFTKDLLADKDLKKRFSTVIVSAFNKELKEARKARTDYRKSLKKAKTETAKQKVEKAWKEKQEKILDPTLREVKTLDGVMSQVNRGEQGKGTDALSKAVFATMTSDKPAYRTKDGVNPSVREEARLLKFIEEPKTFNIMSEAYKKALEVNERKAEELGIPVFPAQWTLWDRIRERIEPHEVMFPDLHKLPRMGRDQIAQTFNASSKAGYAVAPRPIEPTGQDPASLVYFSKKENSDDPILGESKFLVRLQQDEELPEQIRNNLDILYGVRGHREVLESLRPWFRERKKLSYEQMALELGNFSRTDLTPEQKVLVGQILIKRLGLRADALRKKLADKKTKGQLELDGIIETNRLDDIAIDLAQKLAEYGRELGRGVSIFQAFNSLSTAGRIRLAKRQIRKATQARVDAKDAEMQKVTSVLEDLIKVAQQAGFDAMSLEFFRKKSPNLIKLIEEKYAPSLWGAYRKESVNKLHAQIMSALNKSESESSKPTGTPLAQFVNELVAEIKARKEIESGGGPTRERSRSDILRDALLNSEKYADVWHDLAKRTLSDESLTDAQIEELESFFGEMPRDPSGKLVQSTIKERMDKFNLKLQDIAKKSFLDKSDIKTKINEALISDLDLPKDIANKLAIQMNREFNRMVAGEAKKQLDKFKKTTLAPKLKKVTKNTEQFVIEMANLGGFDRADLYDAIAKKLNIPTVDKKFLDEAKRIAQEIENAPEGFQQNNKIIDLMNLIQNKAGDGAVALMMAIRVANLVSGFSTQVVNLSGNLSTAIPMVGTHFIRTKFDKNIGYKIAMNQLIGLKKGLQEAGSVMVTGRGRTGYEMDKFGFDPILERKTLAGGKFNPYNYLKYVHRFMSAMDLAFRFSNIEGKATMLAGMEGKRRGLKGKELRRYIDEALAYDQQNVSTAEAKASAEGLSGLNHKRRVNEILESRRNPELREESEQYGLRSTFQNVPEGFIGALASAVAQTNYPAVVAGQEVPPAKQMLSAVGQFFIPFIRVVANVQNMVFDYTPILGGVRAEMHRRGTNRVRANAKPASDEMVADLHTRHAIGVAMTGVLAYLFFSEEEDEENRLFDVTAGGPKNYQKKKTLMEGGYRPYTVRIAGKEIGYKETPFGGFLAFLGGIKDHIKYGDDIATMPGIMLAGTLAFGRLIFDQAFFKGVSDFVDIAKADDKSVSTFKRLVQQGPGQFAIPNLFQQIDKAMSNEKYDEGQMDSFFGHYILPSVPFIRQMGAPNLDVFGKPVELYSGNYFERTYDRVFRDAKMDPLLEKLVQKKIIPIKANDGQVIRGKEEDEELSTLHRAQDLYVFRSIKGRFYRQLLDEFDRGTDPETGQPRIVVGEDFESQILKESPENMQAISQKLSASATKFARYRVADMSREEVRLRIAEIKKEFDK